VGEVVHATPAVDWAGAYDYDELAEASDGLFIMAYGYHWDGGDPGPLAPLRGGSPWSDYSIAWSVDDYRAFGATDDRIIIGLPLYGDDWPTTDTSVPGTATDDADSVTWVEALAQAEVTGRHWDDVTSTPYTFPSATHQLWYDDFYSLEEKISWSVGEGLQGVGFWALTYEDGDARLWDRVRDLTTTNSRDTDDETPDSDDGGDSPPGSRGRGLGEGCGCAAPGPHGVGLLAVIVGWALPRRRWRQ
jgi:spore germination protein YaaH